MFTKASGHLIKDGLLTLAILTLTFFVSLLLQKLYPSQSLISMLFVLAVFITSLTTKGYIWGIFSSLAGVLVNNFAFTFPFFKINFMITENLISAIVMLIVAIMTSTLTTKIKWQEKINAENDKEKMRANLLRAVSHDLRTPLTTIYGSCSAIIENYDFLSKEHQLRLLGEIMEDSQNLIRMVENLLSVTRINSETVLVSKTPTVLEELIDAVLIKFQKLHPKHPVNVSIPEEFISIPMDAMLIEQVLINILENAVFHAAGMTMLSLRVTATGHHAIFEIADNGCGIAKERLERLFSDYPENPDSPADGGRHGMGIGLTVCSTIIKAHGGTIQAENQKGGGAVFRFSLEMEDSEHEQ